MLDCPQCLVTFRVRDSACEEVLAAPHLQAALQGVVCFSVVKTLVTVFKGAKDLGLAKDDVIVAPHRILRVLPPDREVHIDSASVHAGLGNIQEQTYVLALSMLPSEVLIKIGVFAAVDDKITYLLKEADRPPDVLETELQDCLRLLLERGSDQGLVRVDTEEEGYGAVVRVLDFLLERHLVTEQLDPEAGQQRYRYVSLTEAGKASVTTSLKLHHLSKLCEVPSDKPATDLTVWQLIVKLSRDGWRCVRKRKNPNEAPYVPEDGGPKVWYTSPGATNIAHSYLLCLSEGLHTVHHFRPSSYYTALHEGKPWNARRQGRSRAMAEDVLDVVAEAKAHAKPRVRAARPRVQVPSSGVNSEESADEASMEESNEEHEMPNEGADARDLAHGAELPDLSVSAEVEAEPRDDEVMSRASSLANQRLEEPPSSSTESSSSSSSSSSTSSSTSSREATPPRGDAGDREARREALAQADLPPEVRSLESCHCRGDLLLSFAWTLSPNGRPATSCQPCRQSISAKQS